MTVVNKESRGDAGRRKMRLSMMTSLIAIASALILPCCIAAAAPAVTTTPNAACVGRYDIYELTMTCEGAVSNPWEDVMIAAVFTAPSGKTYNVGGFYDDTKTWKLRFAPMEIGNWAWKLSFEDAGGKYTTSGTFTCTASGNSGFLRVHPKNPYRFVTEGDGQPFYPLGFNWGLSKPYMGPDGKLVEPLPLSEQNFSIDAHSQPTALEDALLSSTNAGYNTFRHNSILDAFNFFGLQGQFNINKTGKNRYDVRQCQLCDGFVAALHKAGIKCVMTFWPGPADRVPKYDLSDAAIKQACLGYHQYLINRYGAYVDIWELANEKDKIPKSYGDAVTAYIREHDPYVHPLTVSNPQQECQNDFDIVSPHRYSDSPDWQIDADVANIGNVYRKLRQPIIVGEFGAGGDVGAYDPSRYRIVIWTAFFNETVILAWTGAPKSVLINGGGANNQYVGWEERCGSKVLTDFISGLDAEAVRVAPTLAPDSQVRGYALTGTKELAAYIIHSRNLNAVITGATIKVDVPADHMQGQWIDPASGAVIQTFAVPGRGPQTFRIPPFKQDIALRLRAGEPASVVQFSPSVYSVRRDQGTIALTVERGGADTAAPLSVTYTTGDGLAKRGKDYMPASDTLTWAAGESGPRTIEIAVLASPVEQASKDFRVVLSKPTAPAALGTAGTALVTVVNTAVNEAAFGVPNYTVKKDAGTLTISVNRLGDGHGPLKVFVRTRGGTAKPGADFTPIFGESLPLTWSDKDMAPKTFSLSILSDVKTPGNKFLVAELIADSAHTPGSNCALYRRSAIDIVDGSVPSPGFLKFSGYLGQVAAGYGEAAVAYSARANQGSVQIPVSRTQGTSGAVSVDYATTNAGTATAGVDFRPVKGTLTWADGDTADKIITVPLIADPGDKGSVTVGLKLVAKSVTGAAIVSLPSSALLTIIQGEEGASQPAAQIKPVANHP